MFGILADSSQWGVVEWTAAAGLITTFVGTLTASIIAIINASKAGGKAIEATTKAESAQRQADTNAHAIIATNQTVTSMARDITPPAVQQRMDLMQAADDARNPKP